MEASGRTGEDRLRRFLEWACWIDGWFAIKGVGVGSGVSILTFSALFIDDKAQVINKRRACEAPA